MIILYILMIICCIVAIVLEIISSQNYTTAIWAFNCLLWVIGHALLWYGSSQR